MPRKKDKPPSHLNEKGEQIRVKKGLIDNGPFDKIKSLAPPRAMKQHKPRPKIAIEDGGGMILQQGLLL